MIKFDTFVRAIQEAIIKANESLITRNNSSFIKMYFDRKSDAESEGSEQPAQSAGTTAGDAPTGDSTSKNSTANTDELLGDYAPKTVTVQFPFATEQGVDYHEVEVPLITLVPITANEITEVTLETDIVISESNNDINLHFNRKLFSRLIGNAKPGRLKIKIAPREPSEGTQIILEGYEKLLRSQIPQ